MPLKSILETRDDLLKLLPQKSIGVEIGVFKGYFSDKAIKEVNPSKFYLIDCWQGKIHSGTEDGKKVEYIEDGEKYYHEVIVPKYEKNKSVVPLRGTSGILRVFDDDFFDWAYLDADHSFLGVQHDLQLLRSKVKPNGIIMGHDYLIPRNYGVVKAVNQFCQKYNLSIEYLTKERFPSYLLFNKK